MFFSDIIKVLSFNFCFFAISSKFSRAVFFLCGLTAGPVALVDPLLNLLATELASFCFSLFFANASLCLSPRFSADFFLELLFASQSWVVEGSAEGLASHGLCVGGAFGCVG